MLSLLHCNSPSVSSVVYFSFFVQFIGLQFAAREGMEKRTGRTTSREARHVATPWQGPSQKGIQGEDQQEEEKIGFDIHTIVMVLNIY